MLEIRRAIEACGVREVAKPMLQRPLPVVQYEIMTGRCSRNPAAELNAETVLKNGPGVQHMVGVKTVGIPQLMRDIDAYSGNCMGYKSRMTSHGFRELARTGAARAGVQPKRRRSGVGACRAQPSHCCRHSHRIPSRPRAT